MRAKWISSTAGCKCAKRSWFPPPFTQGVTLSVSWLALFQNSEPRQVKFCRIHDLDNGVTHIHCSLADPIREGRHAHALHSHFSNLQPVLLLCTQVKKAFLCDSFLASQQPFEVLTHSFQQKTPLHLTKGTAVNSSVC